MIPTQGTLKEPGELGITVGDIRTAWIAQGRDDLNMDTSFIEKQ